jgi:hypothetical protein
LISALMISEEVSFFVSHNILKMSSFTILEMSASSVRLLPRLHASL